MRLIKILTLFFGLFVLSPLSAQETQDKVEAGDILKIGHANNYQYTHVKFPRANFIIKKGGIASYDKQAGVLVEVTEVKTDNRGDINIVLKRNDGKKFFGSFLEIKADYKKALATGELLE